MQAIFAVGSNSSGQLGIGHKEDVSVPKPVRFHPRPPDSEIISFAAGGNHTLLLTRHGDLYWSGNNSSGACGISSASADITAFQLARLVQDDQKHSIGRIVLIAATWEASIIVSQDIQGKRTKIFSLGIGTKGELGCGELIIRTSVATVIPNFPPQGREIVDLAASMGHVVAVLDNGDAYGWGNCRKSQIGEPPGIVHEPRKINKNNVNFEAVRVVCTNEATCLFSDQETGHITVLGSNKWEIVASSPKALPLWADIGAGWGTIYILMQNGALRGWGRNDHGQLPPPNLPRIKRIAIGSEHAVALSEGGDVLAWGWGEHGNCGLQIENNDTKGRWNVIASSDSDLTPANSRIAMVGAGCATSWIVFKRTH